MNSYETILTEIYEHVGVIRLNALTTFDQDPTIGAMVITGNEQVFAAGADIKEMADASAVQMFTNDNIAMYDHIRIIKKPIIAAVAGWCLGGGNELAMSCDMIVAAETARFGQPEINIGVIPGAGGTQRLARTVGKAIAMEMVLNNRILTAGEALQFGLVNRVANVESYLTEALKLASEIAARAPIAIRLGKEVINHAFESFLTDGLADERRAFYFLFSTQDQKEGMEAFIEKRKPGWEGK
jgi:enoyl-CoA hydratase